MVNDTNARSLHPLCRTGIAAGIVGLVGLDAMWAHSTFPAGSEAFFTVGCLGLWIVLGAYALVIAPRRAWPLLSTLTLPLAWGFVYFAAYAAASCDPAIGAIGGFIELVAFLPAGILNSPAIVAAVIAVITALGLIATVVHTRIRFPAWWHAAALASIPIAYALTFAGLWLHGVRPELANCVL